MGREIRWRNQLAEPDPLKPGDGSAGVRSINENPPFFAADAVECREEGPAALQEKRVGGQTLLNFQSELIAGEGELAGGSLFERSLDEQTGESARQQPKKKHHQRGHQPPARNPAQARADDRSRRVAGLPAREFRRRSGWQVGFQICDTSATRGFFRYDSPHMSNCKELKSDSACLALFIAEAFRQRDYSRLTSSAAP